MGESQAVGWDHRPVLNPPKPTDHSARSRARNGDEEQSRRDDPERDDGSIVSARKGGGQVLGSKVMGSNR